MPDASPWAGVTVDRLVAISSAIGLAAAIIAGGIEVLQIVAKVVAVDQIGDLLAVVALVTLFLAAAIRGAESIRVYLHRAR